jgi:hypothetical protein
MSLSSGGKGLTASAVMLCAAVAFSSAVIYDYLAAGIPDLPAEIPFETAGEPVTVSVGEASLEAGSFRLDPLLHRPHALKDVVMRMPRYSIEADSAAMLPRGTGVVFRGADLTAKGLKGDIGTLALRGERVVFGKVRAHGTLTPLRVTSFDAGYMSLPERSLTDRKVSLGRLVDGVADDAANETKRRGGAMEFGFDRLEIAVTMLFQRGYLRNGFVNLSDGKTKVRFARGMYSARHDKVYLSGVEVTREKVRLSSKKGEIRLKTGTLILVPPVEKKTGETAETARDTFEIELK